jgi:hypothetical protein
VAFQSYRIRKVDQEALHLGFEPSLEHAGFWYAKDFVLGNKAAKDHKNTYSIRKLSYVQDMTDT